MSLLALTRAGLHCPEGGFHIDPSRGVEDAVITHSHADHARSGSRRYWCAQSNVALLRARIGASAQVHGVPFGQHFTLGKATVSFHPAGHILGSAQVRIELGGQVWVVSGDYKRDEDPSCEPFEVVPCDVFVTEATFGQPVYRWPDVRTEVMPKVVEWWEQNAAEGKGSVLNCYSLGKTQRVLAELARFAKATALPKPRVLLHSSAMELTRIYAEAGIEMTPFERVEDCTGDTSTRLVGELAIVPPGAGMRTLAKYGPFRSAFASGWILTRGGRGFVISDHADFDSLLRTIRETGAKKVLVTHGSDRDLSRSLRAQGIDAEPLDEVLGGETGGGSQLVTGTGQLQLNLI